VPLLRAFLITEWRFAKDAKSLAMNTAQASWGVFDLDLPGKGIDTPPSNLSFSQFAF
jgi:hypothetical protein